MPGLDLSKIQWPDQMNIREAAMFLGLGEQRVRALHRDGTLKAEDTSGRLIFAKRDLEAFKSQPRKTGGARKEGAQGKAFVIHVTAEKLAAVQDQLGKLGVALEQRYNYEKMRAYQKKRNAAKKAAKTGNEVPPVNTLAEAKQPVPPAQPQGRGVQGILGRRS